MSKAPEKIRLVPNEYHIQWAGRLQGGDGDARLFHLESQLVGGGDIVDYVCSYRFDESGALVDHVIVRVGPREGRDPDAFQAELRKQIDALGDHSVESIWVKPFEVEFDGHRFGLIPRGPEEGDKDGAWFVEAMPGNTLCFYEPWDEGLYDT